MPFNLKQITQPSHEPVSLTDMKTYMRVSYSDQDSVISSKITAARMLIEKRSRRILVNQQWKLTFDKFPGSWPFSYGFGATLLSPYREIHIPLCPVVSIDSFQYIDMNSGDLVTMTQGTDYQVSLDSEPARLQPGYGQAWPVARWVLDAGQITFTAGYGDTQQSPIIGTDPPALILEALKMTVAHLYENRELQEMPETAMSIMDDNYRVVDFAPVMNNWERFGR